MKKNKIIKNSAWYFGGTIVSAILGLINTPLLTRVLEPKVYAQYGMLISFTTVLATFIYLGQDEAFMRFFSKRKEDYKTFLWRCIRIPLMLCAIVMILLLEPSHTLLNWVFESDLPLISCIIVGIYIIVMVVQRFLLLTARMEERAVNFVFSNVATKGGFIVAILVFYFIFKSLSFDAIVICLLFGVIMALAINLFVITKIPHGINSQGENVSSKEMLLYGLPFAFSTTLSFGVPLVEKLIIREQTNWETLAIYTAAAIFITVMNLVKTTVNSVWIPYAYKNYQNEERFKTVFYNVGICLTSFCMLIISGTVLTRRWLVFMFDSKYYEAMLITPAIVCGACFDSLSSIYAIGINISQKTKYHIIVPVAHLVVSAVLLFGLLPVIGLRATGLAYIVSIAISRYIQIHIAFKQYDTGKDNKPLLIFLCVGVIISILSLFITSLTFDIICAFFLVGATVVFSRKEVVALYKWYRNDRLAEANSNENV